MFKVGITALLAIPLAFTSAKAFDNARANRAAAAFAQFGVQGLAVAGQMPAGEAFPQSGPFWATPVGLPAYTPICWTRYVTAANGNTLMTVPIIICR
jgi:hypothetical protein